MMKRGYPSPKLCALLLAVLLLWRMLGAPVTAEQFAQLGAPMRQARALLPARLLRVWTLWLPAPAQAPETLLDEAMSADERALAAMGGEAEPTLAVFLSEENRLTTMPLESYVCGVVAAEMPAAYHMEALKAQAVAARTRALWQAEGGGCSEHAGADICTHSAHCQGYATISECQALWGNEYEAYRDRVLAAVQATEGQLLTYAGKPITVMYHAMSGGVTEDASAVFSQSLPYLVSVSSTGEESARGFYTDTTVPYEQIAEALNLPGVDAVEVRQTFSIGEYTPTGRVSTVLIGDEIIQATRLRQALGLRSTLFTISMDGEGVTFHQQGYGHGVGMSQVGANAMAASGSGYADILGHYYPGVTLEGVE